MKEDDLAYDADLQEQQIGKLLDNNFVSYHIPCLLLESGTSNE